MNTINNNQSTIRRVLEANAVFSATSGLFFFVAAKPLAEFLGASQAVMTIVMVILFGYAALLTYSTSRPSIHRHFVLFTVIGDSLWVLGSILLLAVGWFPFTVDAKWAIGIVAVCVDVFATLQFFQWRKMNG